MKMRPHDEVPRPLGREDAGAVEQHEARCIRSIEVDHACRAAGLADDGAEPLVAVGDDAQHVAAHAREVPDRVRPRQRRHVAPIQGIGSPVVSILHGRGHERSSRCGGNVNEKRDQPR